MKKSTLVKAAILTAIVPMNVSATLYWDLNDVASGAGTNPTGTWDTTTFNWNTNAAGTDPTVNWTASETAVFSADSDATGPFTVSA